MKTADGFGDRYTVSKKITRSRFHYKPISSAELLLTIVLSTFIGVGVFAATIINTQSESTNSQILSSPVEQCFDSTDTNLLSNV